MRVKELAELAPRLLERLMRRGGAFADVFYEHSVYHQHTLRQRAVRGLVAGPSVSSRRREVEGAALRICCGDAEGFAVSADLSPAALEAAAEAAAYAIDGGAAGRVQSGTLVVHPAPPDAPDTVSDSEKAALLQAAADAALAAHPDVRMVTVTYQDRVRRTLVVTSSGQAVLQAVPLVGLRVDVTVEHRGRSVRGRAMGGAARGFGAFFDHPPEHVAREAVAGALLQAEARAGAWRSGPMPVVVQGGWGGVWLHEAVGHGLEADVAGAPVESIGRRIASTAVTLVDDGTLPGGRGTAACDDEGTPTGRTMLIERGILRGLLTDRRRAEAFGLPRTGNARRQDYRSAPLPRMTNLCLAPGDAAPDDLITCVEDGLYVATVGRGIVEAGANRFAFEVVDGYRIEQGRRTVPVTGLRVEGRLDAVLGRIAGVANDFQLDTARGHCSKAGQIVPVSVGTPTVLLEGMEVRGA